MHKAQLKQNRGQSLIEILIGVAIGAILIGGAAATITLTLRSNVQNKNIQVASSLSQAILDKVTVFADADWHNIDEVSGIVLGESYHVVPKSGGLERASGDQTETVEGIVFSTHFIVDSVHRNSSTEKIEESSGVTYEDPSTKKISAITTWTEKGEAANITVNKYITRSRSLIVKQTDWSGGKVTPADPVVSSADSEFYDSKGIKFSASGLIKKLGF